jgi:hypothetical protein
LGTGANVAEQTWQIEAFLDNTLVIVTIKTDDFDAERGQDVGKQLHFSVESLLAQLTLADAANRALGTTFADMRRRARL